MRTDPMASSADVEIPMFESERGSTSWFVAMEYYALILNRTYKVFVTDRMLCGAKVRGLVSNPMMISPQMFDQAYWADTQSAKIYDRMDVASTIFLQANSVNFQIGWKQIAEIEYLAKRKWGMGNVPHSGRIILHLRSNRQRELILLGKQNGPALKAKLDQFIHTDVVVPAIN